MFDGFLFWFHKLLFKLKLSKFRFTREYNSDLFGGWAENFSKHKKELEFFESFASSFSIMLSNR